ncbi:MAG: V-type ATP synthase subunit D [Clostridiaceae bacterium]|jgi:V/A-type H+-transporting ATPase subunit D|nr:V-type ATP synthase subunit D [Clostridiaceae bacterium]HZJ91227.1 V-type ATP synthase subunit D [Oscillospiraceae bacterium]
MAVKRVNPNRMELLRLKQQLQVARRGHKLMKDKRDELMRQFLELVREVADLRIKMEKLLNKANAEMVLARASMGSEVVEAALMTDSPPLELIISEENTMGVRSPTFQMPAADKLGDKATDLPYAMTSATGELDQAVDALYNVFPVMMELAELEHKALLMADEIERTRRRVNSLEYVMIPDLQDTIRSITMKMEEHERESQTRLMKVKDLILEAEIKKKQEQSDQRRAQNL